MMKTASIIAILCVITTGCATAKKLNWNDSAEITGSIEIEYDEFAKITEYTGPVYSDFSGYRSHLFLRAFKHDKLDRTDYQVYVYSYYCRKGWRFYNRAYDSEGNRLEIIVIDRNVESCGRNRYCCYWEHIGVNIAQDYLEKHKEAGMRFKLAGKGGSEVFCVPAAYIKAFLNRVKN